MAESREFRFKNNARSSLAAGLTADAEFLRVQPGDGPRFPDVASSYYEDAIFSIVLWNLALTAFEVCYVIDIDGDVLFVERGKEGSTPLAFEQGAIVVHNVTAGFFEQQQDFITSGAADEVVLTGTVLSDDEIHLSWTEAAVTPPGNIISLYRIFRAVDGGGHSLFAETDELEYSDDTVDLSTHSYSYYVIARPLAGADSGQSNVETFSSGTSVLTLYSYGSGAYDDFQIAWDAPVPFPANNFVVEYDIHRALYQESVGLFNDDDSIKTAPGASTDFQLMNADYTYEVTFTQLVRAGTQVVVCIGGLSSFDAGQYLSISSSGRLVASFANQPHPTPAQNVQGADDAIQVNTKYHVAVVKQGLAVRVYLNGVLYASATLSFQPLVWQSDFRVYLGNYYLSDGASTEGLQGAIHEARFTKEALYSSDFSPTAELGHSGVNMKALLHFDRVTTTTNFVDDTHRTWTAVGGAVLSFITAADQAFSVIDTVPASQLHFIDDTVDLMKFQYQYYVTADPDTGPDSDPSNIVNTVQDACVIEIFADSGTFTPGDGVTEVSVLLVAGGASGGTDNAGGGGGAGGVIFDSEVPVVPGTPYPIVRGAGGVHPGGSTTPGVDGGNSTAFGFTAVGGGGGGAGNIAFQANYNGRPGGSGGGGGAFFTNGGPETTSAGGAATAGQGHAGGGSREEDTESIRGGAGGGGAGEAGETSVSPNAGGDGGDGLPNSITGTSTYYGGGGGGGGASFGTGGLGGGGDGGDDGPAPEDGTANTGGGGGGRGFAGVGDPRPAGDGGSGIVIVRYVP